jgi:hypothetical protein
MAPMTVSRPASSAAVVCWAWARSSPPCSAASNVAVYQADLVRGMQRFGDLLDDAYRPRRLQWPAPEDGLQVAALDELHIHI